MTVFDVIFDFDTKSEYFMIDKNFREKVELILYLYLNSIQIIGKYSNYEQDKLNCFKIFLKFSKRYENLIPNIILRNNPREFILLIVEK